MSNTAVRVGAESRAAVPRPRAIAKRLEVRIFAPGNKSSHAIHLHAGEHKAFTEEGISSILENCASDLEQRFPGEEYRLVELSGNKFNFVWVESKRPDGI